jgi:hypothetical protein
MEEVAPCKRGIAGGLIKALREIPQGFSFSTSGITDSAK